jgi:hypothetical protein
MPTEFHTYLFLDSLSKLSALDFSAMQLRTKNTAVAVRADH